MTAGSTADAVLEIRDLSVDFRTRNGAVRAVDHLSFSLRPGQVLGVVGESGSGKSVSMKSILGLIRDANAHITGEVHYGGRDLLKLSDKQLQDVRGRQIAMVFQDPMTSLTPVYTVGWHIAEQVRAHERVTKQAARARAIQLLREVGIPAPERRVDAYPHELSGGMRQRAVIAMALSCSPEVLIADEPTTALDVTTQAQILDLILQLRQVHGSSVILITHDMGVVSQVADSVLVMYGGRVVERGSRQDVFHRPRHPYTWGLLGAVPRVSGPRTERLVAIPGSPLAAGDYPPGCAFAPRCLWKHAACSQVPALAGEFQHDPHEDACWLPRGDRQGLRRKTVESLRLPEVDTAHEGS